MVSAATGVLLLRLSWPHGMVALPPPLGVVLGIGLGAGLSAVFFFLWLLVVGPSSGFPQAEVGFMAVAAIASLLARPAARRMLPPSPADGHPSELRLLLAVAGLMVLGVAGAAFLSTLRLFPHGEWDAWMNWNLHARMIFRGGAEWRTAFSPAIPWSHPDYPVLVPFLVVRAWLYAGTETLRGPALVAATFTFGTAALLAAALAALRGPSQGLLAGVVLLSTPFFIRHGASLYADVPLSFFLLATIVFLAFDARYGAATARFAALAGVTAGLAMWTKNEGLLFTLAVGTVLLAVTRSGPSAGKRLGAFGAGMLPLLLLVAAFKIAFAPPNDLLSTLAVDRTLGRLTDPQRYYVATREYLRHLASFGNNGLASAPWLLAACLLALGVNHNQSDQAWARAGAAAMLLLLAGHFIVFVSMADELARLLDSSLERLLLQIWPSVLFLFFLAVRTPEELGVRRLSSRDAAETAGGQ
jgi:hypothetical protein